MKRFGLIGFPLIHSFSKKYFTEKFQREGITNCSYENFPLRDIRGITQLLEKNDLYGLNVTIPYKEMVLPYLTHYDKIVLETGASNCIKINGSNTEGYNTDVMGFKISLQKNLKPYHSSALILGQGGAAKSVAYVLSEMGIRYNFVTRKESDEDKILFTELTESIVNIHPLIINCTPLGMYPSVETCPPIPYDGITNKHFLFDLVYNPEKSLFLQYGEKRGAIIQNGLEMLIIQAEESWKIWNT